MTYTKQSWADGDPTKPLSAVRMGVLEQGVADAHTAVAALSSGVVASAVAVGKLYAGLATATSQPARIAFAGSSTTAGTAASTQPNRWVNRFVTGMQATYGGTEAVQASTTADFTASSSAGVQGYNLGQGGTTAADYFTDAEVTKVAALNPRVIIHMIGANDYINSVPHATYKANVFGRVNALKAAVNGPLVQILVHTYQRMDGTGNHAYDGYGQALADIATADPDNVAFFDISGPYRLVGVPGADPLDLITSDNIHQGNAGHALMADLMRRAVDLSAALVKGPPATAVPRPGRLKVASADLPADVKAGADYVCSGTNDQAQINAALLRASRPGDGYGGEGHIGVELVGPNFYVGQNGATIKVYPVTELAGAGPGTLIQPLFPSFADQGCIELINDRTNGLRLTNLSIGRPNSTLSRCHGIKLAQTASATDHEIDTGNDPFCRIDHVQVLKPQGCGIWLTGTSGGARESQVEQCLLWDTGSDGLRIDGSSDSQIIAVRSQPQGGHGFAIGGGNTKVADSKSYYSDGAFDGFNVTSGRAELTGCAAQDSGRWGFYLASADCTVVSAVADSNARNDTSGGGFYISAPGIYEALHAFDRGQTASSPQLRGIVFGGSPQVRLTGRVKVPSGSAHIVGSPGANSSVTVVRDGLPVYTG